MGSISCCIKTNVDISKCKKSTYVNYIICYNNNMKGMLWINLGVKLLSINIMDIWSNLNWDKKEDSGELIIDGNSISFRLKDCSFDMGSTFINKKDFDRYIVSTNGIKSSDGTGYFLDVIDVFKYDGNYNEFNQEIDKVKSVSFNFPELANWLKIQSVEYAWGEEDVLIAYEVKKEPIILKDNSLSIRIEYETESPFARNNDRTEFLLRNSPKVIISYYDDVSHRTAFNDIFKLMRFFGLIIGRVSCVENIILTTASKKIRAYKNFDFSHNVKERFYTYNYRINYSDIFEKINDYVDKWYEHVNDESFNFILSAFFSCKTRGFTALEDYYLTYCRFLEGYDLIRNEEEKKSKEVEKKICNILKSENDVIELFKSIFDEFSDSIYKPAKVAEYISKAFMERKGLQSRIEKLDEDFFSLIENNCNRRVNISNYKTFIEKMVKTRNYYSHFNSKADEKLSFSQMIDTVEIFEAMIVSILLYEIGMDKEEIRKFLRKDEKYHFIFQPKE